MATGGSAVGARRGGGARGCPAAAATGDICHDAGPARRPGRLRCQRGRHGRARGRHRQGPPAACEDASHPGARPAPGMPRPGASPAPPWARQRSWCSAGIDDVLIANEVVDPAKIARLVRLADRASVTVAVDAATAVELLSREAVRTGATIKVLIDVDVLIHRCGVASPAEALALARSGRGEPGPGAHGIMGYEGRIRPGVPDRAARIATAYETLARTRAVLLGMRALHVSTVSASAPRRSGRRSTEPVITELQSGVYAVMEPELPGMGLPFRCAVAVRGTVISSHPDRAVLDIGRRSIGMEYGPPIPCRPGRAPGRRERRAHQPLDRWAGAAARQPGRPRAGPGADDLQPPRGGHRGQRRRYRGDVADRGPGCIPVTHRWPDDDGPLTSSPSQLQEDRAG